MRLGAALILLSVLIGACIDRLGTPSFDPVLVDAARSLRDGVIGSLMRSASAVGFARWLAPIAAVAALALGVRTRLWRSVAALAVGVPLAALAASQLKLVWERPRPEGSVDVAVSGWAMPSGHAAASVAFAVSLSLALVGRRGHRMITWVAGSFAALVCSSRVVLGVHWPTDVLAGALLGAGVSLMVHRAVRQLLATG